MIKNIWNNYLQKLPQKEDEKILIFNIATSSLSIKNNHIQNLTEDPDAIIISVSSITRKLKRL